MSKNDGGPAFAHGNPEQGGDPGMSLRDWFAGQVAAALAAGNAGMFGDSFSAYAKGDCNAVIADRAYALADAMLKAREGEQ